jgi:hypothetical protein
MEIWPGYSFVVVLTPSSRLAGGGAALDWAESMSVTWWTDSTPALAQGDHAGIQQATPRAVADDIVADDGVADDGVAEAAQNHFMRYHPYMHAFLLTNR